VGILKAGGSKKNKCATLFNSKSHVVSLASGIDGVSFVSGHENGNIFRYTFPDQQGHFGPSKVSAIDGREFSFRLGVVMVGTVANLRLF
jgi:hypothetical protein